MKMIIQIGLMLMVSYLADFVPIAPSSNRSNRKGDISNELQMYIGNLFETLEDSPELINHVSGSYANGTDIDFSLFSSDVLTKLHQVKMDTKNKLIELSRIRVEDGKSVFLPRDLVEVMDAGHPSEFSAQDIKQIIKTIRERQEGIHREEDIVLEELEVAEILQRWESHVNQSEEERLLASKAFEEEKRLHPKRGSLHEPASKIQEREEWTEGDDLPEDSFDDTLFFKRHDLNSDGYWDAEEVIGVLSVQIGNMHEKSPVKRQKYLDDMTQRVFELIDKDFDGLISLEEHKEHMKSSAAEDDGWTPEEDDLDEMGALETEKDFDKIAAKIKKFERLEPDSKLVKALRARYERLQRQANENKSRREHV